MQVTITINGEQVSREIEPRKLLVHFVREDAGLRGTHWGCDTSNCGACTLWVDGEAVSGEVLGEGDGGGEERGEHVGLLAAWYARPRGSHSRPARGYTT